MLMTSCLPRPPPGVQDAESFQLEMRAFLVELCCPHSVLTQDLGALAVATNRLLLVGELGSTCVSFLYLRLSFCRLPPV